MIREGQKRFVTLLLAAAILVGISAGKSPAASFQGELTVQLELKRPDDPRDFGLSIVNDGTGDKVEFAVGPASASATVPQSPNNGTHMVEFTNCSVEGQAGPCGRAFARSFGSTDSLAFANQTPNAINVTL